MLRTATLLGLAVASLVGVGQEVWAKPKNHCPPGHAKKGWCSTPNLQRPAWDDPYHVRRREDSYDRAASPRYYVRRAPRVEYYDDDRGAWPRSSRPRW